MAIPPICCAEAATSGFPDFSPVPSAPFRFFSLPSELRRHTLLLYLRLLPERGSPKTCPCFKSLRGIAKLSDDHPCYNLHSQFKCHAKFLPLLMTSRQMHEEFRPLRYAHGTFSLLTPKNLRALYLRHFPGISYTFIATDRSPFSEYSAPVITPFPENFYFRQASQAPHPALELHKVPAGIWNEIRYVSIEMDFGYQSQWESVLEVLEYLITTIKERTVPLRELAIVLKWERVEEDTVLGVEFGEKTNGEIWSSMVEPLGMIRWGREGAEKVAFRGQDYWDGDAAYVADGGEENAELRVFRCTNFVDFAKGLQGADREGRLEVSRWRDAC